MTFGFSQAEACATQDACAKVAQTLVCVGFRELVLLVFVYDDGDTRRLHMAQHVKIIGILHIVFSSLLILAGVICLLVMGGIAGVVGTTSHSSDDLAAVPLLGGIGGLIFVLFL